MKTLLLVFHSRGAKTAAMADAVARQALLEAQAGSQVQLVVKRAPEAGPDDLLAADALVLGTPENFGYMSGLIKDFLERVFYPCEDGARDSQEAPAERGIIDRSEEKHARPIAGGDSR